MSGNVGQMEKARSPVALDCLGTTSYQSLGNEIIMFGLMMIIIIIMSYICHLILLKEIS